LPLGAAEENKAVAPNGGTKSAFAHPHREIAMPIDFTEDEKAALIDLLVGVIENDPFPLSERVQRLRGILTKVRPMPELPPEEPNRAGDEPVQMMNDRVDHGR
jgi:hypothetical protein